MDQHVASEHTDRLTVSLFGKFSVRFGNQTFDDLGKYKVQELFGYLLLHHDRPHPRENLASLLWGEVSTAQSKSYLRKALWQLQAALTPCPQSALAGLLAVEPEWIQLNSAQGLWLDAASFESTFKLCQNHDGRQLEKSEVLLLQKAVELYRGDLLEGWFQEWCLYERERFQHMALVMLDKLIIYSETHQEYEAGIHYATRLLQYDQARERTHRQLMRLYYLVGDRTEALRQYERCVALLHKELGVGPARQTVAIYEQIRTDRPAFAGSPAPENHPLPANQANETTNLDLPALLEHMQSAERALTEAQRTLQQNIKQLEILVQQSK